MENSLILFGIPENVIHTFSFADPEDVILINLKLIEFSMHYERCLFFVKNHFFVSLSKIIMEEHPNVNRDSFLTAFSILYQMYQFFQESEYLNPQFFFKDIRKIFQFAFTYENDEPILTVCLSLIKALMENDPEYITQCQPEHKEQIKRVLQKLN